MRGIVWFREDLRLHDNRALAHAAKKCADGVIGLYIIDERMWERHHMATCRVEFLLRGLQLLHQNLATLNIPLVIKHSSSAIDEIITLITQSQAKALFYNRQYEVNELKRDTDIQQQLAKRNIPCFSFDDQVVLAPGSVTTQQGDYFKVYTAFKRAWHTLFLNQPHSLLKPPKAQQPINIITNQALSNVKSTIDPELWPSGEQSAMRRLKQFIKKDLFLYDKQRDFPALDTTSKLSPYLSSGMISPRQCFLAAFDANNQELDTGNKGAITWMSELIWRDFYKHLLVAVPRLSMHRAFKPATEKIKWAFNEKKYIAWQLGKTGIPIIDAAMRQLNRMGWMHNRLRMIVAMFFTKNLFFDWRLGEDYFIRHLIDGDLSANNGGWQWSASTGTDAAPYFRIFNPIKQSERFDPRGIFIRKYCPELNDFDDYAIHAPHERMPLLAEQVNYPQPIVDLEISRKHAIEVFKRIT